MKLSKYIYLLFVGLALSVDLLVFTPQQIKAQEIIRPRCEGTVFNITYGPRVVVVPPSFDVQNVPVVNRVTASVPNPIRLNFQINDINTFNALQGRQVRLVCGLPGPGLNITTEIPIRIGPWVPISIPVDLGLNVYRTTPVTVREDSFSLEIAPGWILNRPDSSTPNVWLFQPGANGAGHSCSLHSESNGRFSEYCSQVNYTVVTDPSQAQAVANQQQNTTSAGQVCTFQSSTGRETGILTAVGCIPFNTTSLVNAFVVFASLAGGGIALLLMAFSAIQMITQGSDPKVLQEAQQRFVAAIAGLLFIIFAVLILRIIGVDILQIPGFGR